MIDLHLPVIAVWTGGDLGDAQLALLDLLLAFFATRRRLRKSLNDFCSIELSVDIICTW